MKLYALEVLFKDPASGSVTGLHCTQDLASFSYFQRGSVKEFMNFTSKILAERTLFNSRASVKEQEYMCHVYVQGDGLACVIIADHEYPKRVAHNLCNTILQEFATLHPSNTWKGAVEGSKSYPNGATLLQKYQNPREADSLSKVQAEVDETKIILHSTIEAVLQRGEKLDDLVAKSEELSGQSKAFYKTAKKTNSCCTIL